ncbi:MAG: phage terminase large subunit [Chloroflexi bacterium]|nr:phage terminase large subunit [Chloroflexota bacterium]
MCSQYFPAWFVATHPNKSVILTSYEADYAASWGRKARDILEEWGEKLFGITVRDDSSAAKRWQVTGHQGGMQTAGVGGPLTGKGADILIIDDPVKNDQEANSATYREHAWEWYKSTAYTRLEPGASLLLIMTHWHEDDLAGKILQDMKDGGEKWVVISLPAMAEENDQLGRTPGDPLWPSRYPKKTLENIKRTVGPYWWGALYQQRPSRPQGTVFQLKDFRYFRRDEEHYLLSRPEGVKRWRKDQCYIFQTVDTAETENKKADYTAVATWAVTPDSDLLLLDMVRVQLETPDLTPTLRQASDKWSPAYIGIEGRPVFQQARRAGLPVRRLRPDKDKWTRAQPASARLSAGSVYFLAGASWIDDLEAELLAFPTGTNDDQVDVVAYAALEMQKGKTDPTGSMTAEIL